MVTPDVSLLRGLKTVRNESPILDVGSTSSGATATMSGTGAPTHPWPCGPTCEELNIKLRVAGLWMLCLVCVEVADLHLAVAVCDCGSGGECAVAGCGDSNGSSG